MLALLSPEEGKKNKERRERARARASERARDDGVNSCVDCSVGGPEWRQRKRVVELFEHDTL